MKYLLFLLFGLVSCANSISKHTNTTNKVNSNPTLTKMDSVFIHNIIYNVENTVEDSADYHLMEDLTIELNVRLVDGVVRTYILNRNGTIEDLADIKSDGSIIVYGEEGE